MAELVENKICAHCGADVRPESLFCYSCGSSVAPNTVVALKDKSDFDAQRNVLKMPENGAGKTTKLVEPPIGKITDEPMRELAANNAELKSAAAMRRKSKIYQPKRTEIVWEERGNSANIWFVLTAIVLTLAAAGIFYLAVYLK